MSTSNVSAAHTFVPFFSIITASLNNAGTIEDTLRSVADQSFQDVEHIVVDGGSKDGTLSILEQYHARYPIRWRSEADQGISDALNKGVRDACGRYLLVLQADDHLVDNNVLENVHRIAYCEKYDIYTFPVLVSLKDNDYKLHAPSRLPRLRYHFKNIFRHQGTFIHRRVYEQIGLYCDKFSISMDYDFFYRALDAECTSARGNLPVSVMGGGGISRTQQYRRIQEEALVQQRNERNPYWRFAQSGFRVLYIPYRLLIHFLASKRRALMP